MSVSFSGQSYCQRSTSPSSFQSKIQNQQSSFGNPFIYPLLTTPSTLLTWHVSHHFRIASSTENSLGEIKQQISAKVAWYSEIFAPEAGTRRFIRAQEDLFGDTSGTPYLEIEDPKRNRRIRIDGTPTR